MNLVTNFLNKLGYTIAEFDKDTGIILASRDAEEDVDYRFVAKRIRYYIQNNYQALSFRCSEVNRLRHQGIKPVWYINNTVGYSRDWFDEKYELDIIKAKREANPHQLTV